MFTDYYGEQSCTAGRASFITGQHGLRTGLTKVGLPGATLGLQKEDPTIAELLKPLGYATGQFGKNHLGDRNEFLPTVHGFDEFYGNLYHLNAEEEPEHAGLPEGSGLPHEVRPARRAGLQGLGQGRRDRRPALRQGRQADHQGHRPADPASGWRRSTTTSPTRAVEFIERQAKADKPFFVWVNFTHMHFRTHAKPESKGQSGRWQGEYADAMIDHDKNVGTVLKALDDAGIADNTFVMYSTDNGPHMNYLAGRRHDAVPQREELELGRGLPGAVHGPLAGQDQAGHACPTRSSATTTGCRRLLADRRRAGGQREAAQGVQGRRHRPTRSTSTATTSCRYLTGQGGEEPAGVVHLLQRRPATGRPALRQLEVRVHASSGPRGRCGSGPSRSPRSACRRSSTSASTPTSGPTSPRTPTTTGLIDHAFLLVPAQDYVGKFLMTFKEYPAAAEGRQLQRRSRCWRSCKSRR